MYNNSSELLSPTIRNIGGYTKSLSWFLGDFDSQEEKSIDLIVNCSDGSCSDTTRWLKENNVTACGMTSIVNKIPILITGVEEKKGPTDFESDARVISSQHQVKTSGMNNSTEDIFTPAMNSTTDI